MLLEPIGDGTFVEFSLGDVHDKIETGFQWSAHIVAVQPQHEPHSFKPNPLVPIDDWVI